MIRISILSLIVLIVGFVTSDASISSISKNFKNVTVIENETAHLRCEFNNDSVENNLVLWIRKNDSHILTSGYFRYTSDPRFSSSFTNNEWVLEIKNVKPSDSGLYECRMSSENGDLVSEPTIIYLLNIKGHKSNIKDLKDILNLLNLSSDEQDIKIKDIINKAEDILKKAEDESGHLNPAMIVNEFLSDPLPIKDFNISESGGLTYYDGRFQNMTLVGLKRLKFKSMVFNLGLMELKVIMDLPVIKLSGDYELDGKVTFFPFYGSGKFWMNITGLEIRAYGALNRSDNGRVEVGDIDIGVRTKDINLHFENMMGGGTWGSITNTLINQLSNLIFTQLKHLLLDEVAIDMKAMINQQLSNLPLDFVDEKSNNIFDGILDYSKKAIPNRGLEPLKLPDLKDNFDYKFLVFQLRGQIEISEGRLYGLSTLVRTGDIIATYRNNEVTFEASLGFQNLTGDYKWAAKLMGGGPSGSSSLSISSISCYLRLKQSLKKGSPPRIDVFKVEHIKHLWVDVDGLGSWDFILEIIVNLISNAFKVSLANAISGPVTHAIQQELDHLPISFISNS